LSITKVCEGRIPNIVIPAQAGIQRLAIKRRWVPAFAGTTPVLWNLAP